MTGCSCVRRGALVVVLLASGVVARADDAATSVRNTQAETTPLLSPAEALKRITVPAGFRVSLFAGEPQVRQPIGLTTDARGRVWVAENDTYAEAAVNFDLSQHDRIVILEDADHDGNAERRKVFWDQGQRLTSVELGFGGVWALCPPNLLFIPDRNGDDVPDGPPQVVLDGWNTDMIRHNIANGLRWGPDGWLYGRQGIQATSFVGPPATPRDQRTPLNCSVWRYHSTLKQFEAVCHGTTNPWGHDWDRLGEAFFINTVNGHLWHVIAGAHLERPHTINANPLVYEPIEMHADHWHFDTGKGWGDSRTASGEHDRLGGGHAHVGMAIYLGKQWPAAYQGRLFTLNQHGRRMNVERLEREGSGYVGRHEPDILFAGDPWFRGVEVTYGPDGGVYLVDWSDTGECHENTGVHRSSGRIYKVTYGRPELKPAADLTRASLTDLAAAQTDDNEWLVRAARRELTDRKARGDDTQPAIELLKQMLTSGDAVVRLRAIWALASLEAVSPAQLYAMLADADEHVRTWGIRLLTDRWPLDTATGGSRAESLKVDGAVLDAIVARARDDESGLVRLAAASTLARLPMALRPKLAAALLAREEDAEDHNLPVLIWQTLVPLADAQPEQLIALAADARLPQFREWTARRLAELAGKKPDLLADLFARVVNKPYEVRRDVVLGAVTGLAGQRKAPMPDRWPALLASFSPSPAELADALRTLGVLFGDGRALDEVRRLALDEKATLDHRRAALETLIEAGSPDLREVCEKLLKVRFLNTTALAGLARFDDPTIGRQLAKSYRSFHHSERAAVIETLVSRPSFAGELLDQMAAGGIGRGDLSAAQARQIRSFGDATLTERLAAVWGELRDSPADKQQLIGTLKKQLTPDRLAKAYRSHGRAIFTKSCATCHRLFGSGAEIGPDLTGGNRKNLDYLLSNIVDPSAVVSKDYLMSVLALGDGRVVNGIVTSENEAALIVQTAQGRQVIARSDIEDKAPSKLSLMPDGLLQPLQPADIADLVAYLMSETQVEVASAP